MHMRTLLGLTMLAFLAGLAPAAEPTAPPPPAEYAVILRYQIEAARNERLVQFHEMVRYLESIGFKKDPARNENEAEDPTATEMTGSIASANARKLLGARHVRTVLLFAKGSKVPTEGDKPVRANLELTSGLPADLQTKLFAQVRQVLASIGFREAVGYDNRGDTRIVGNVPAKALFTLLQDLRRTPGGEKEPTPFKGVTPVRVVEVLLGMALAQPAPAQPAAPEGQETISPELRALLADKEEAGRHHRMELILLTAPTGDDLAWQ
jgi:hypothetical protein